VVNQVLWGCLCYFGKLQVKEYQAKLRQIGHRIDGMKKKADLPVKACAQCGKPMVWRKKWAKNWEEVKYCSERCQGDAKAGRRSDR
jgi:hypothetical protein